jgi:hypothetical protein
VFAKNLNMPTGIAFLGNATNFQVFVLESGHGLPSVCNDEMAWPGGPFDTNNPFTLDILVFNRNGTLIRGPIGKPTSSGGGFQPSGPAIDVAFVNGLSGGPLFATDSNQSTHQHNGQNNSSRIITVNPMTGAVTPFITNLPTGDHPTEQLAFRGDGWIYWSQGSTTNSGVVGLDNGGGQNQSDIPCQDRCGLSSFRTYHRRRHRGRRRACHIRAGRAVSRDNARRWLGCAPPKGLQPKLRTLILRAYHGSGWWNASCRARLCGYRPRCLLTRRQGCCERQRPDRRIPLTTAPGN